MNQADNPLKTSVPGSGALAPDSNYGPADDKEKGFVKLLFLTAGILRARRGLFFCVAALIFIGVVIATYARSPKYESSAKLMVQLDMQTVALSQSDVRYNLAMKMADEAVGTQVELLRSKALIERVIDQLGENVPGGKAKSGDPSFITGTLIALGLIDQTSPREGLAQTIGSGLKITPARKSQMIDISLRFNSREGAQRILATLIEQHLKKLDEIEATSQAYGVYSTQAAQLKSELEKAEAALAAFKLKHRFVDLASEKAMMLQNANRLKSLLDGTEGGGEAAAVNVEASGDTLAGMDGGAGGSDLARLVSRVNDLRLEQTRRAAIYVPGHVKLDEVNGQLGAAKKLLKSRKKNIRHAVEGYLARSTALDGMQPEFNQLTRDVGVREDNYKAYIKATEDRRLASAKDRRVMLMVIDPPPLPEAALPPTRLMVLLGGLFGSLIFATVWVLLANWWGIRARSMKW